MRYARVTDGVVCEIWEAPEGVTPEKAFHPSIAQAFVPCKATTKEGFTYDGKAFAPAQAASMSKADLRSAVSSKRWSVETAGISVDGIPVATNDRSKVMILGARMKAEADPGFSTNWKTGDGFRTVDAAAIIAISDAVTAHIDACFAMEADLLTSIEKGSITTREEIDAAAWPA